MCVGVCVEVCVYIYIYILYIHTYIYTYICVCIYIDFVCRYDAPLLDRQGDDGSAAVNS